MQPPDNAPCPVCAVALRPLAAVTNRHETGGARALALLACGQCARHFVWERVAASAVGLPGEERLREPELRLLGPVVPDRAPECLRLMRACPAPDQAACPCPAHPFLHEMCRRLDNVWVTKRQH